MALSEACGPSSRLPLYISYTNAVTDGPVFCTRLLWADSHSSLQCWPMLAWAAVRCRPAVLQLRLSCCSLQVLAGAGPAFAAVPLVVVWAGGSAVSLVQGIARRQVGAAGTASRIGFVAGQTIAQVGSCPACRPFLCARSCYQAGESWQHVCKAAVLRSQRRHSRRHVAGGWWLVAGGWWLTSLARALSQVLNAFSRMGASVLTWVPPPRGGHFSDTALLQRVVQRPQSSLDAFARGAGEAGTGLIAGVSGLVIDPMQVRCCRSCVRQVSRRWDTGQRIWRSGPPPRYLNN